MLTKARLQAATLDWLEANMPDGDTAGCLHFANATKARFDLSDRYNVSRYVKRYFKELERKTFRLEGIRQGKFLKRFVTLEHCPNAGWHIHFICKTPEHVSQDLFNMRLKLFWKKVNGNREDKKFGRYMTYVKPITGDYAGYITKRSFDEHSAVYCGEIDWENVRITL